jgi:hypothetical protein
MPLPFCDHAADTMRLVEIQISIFMMRFAALSLAAVCCTRSGATEPATSNVCFLVHGFSTRRSAKVGKWS